MNPNIELIKKYLADNDSVSHEELLANSLEANSAWNNACDAYEDASEAFDNAVEDGLYAFNVALKFVDDASYDENAFAHVANAADAAAKSAGCEIFHCGPDVSTRKSPSFWIKRYEETINEKAETI